MANSASEVYIQPMPDATDWAAQTENRLLEAAQSVASGMGWI